MLTRLHQGVRMDDEAVGLPSLIGARLVIPEHVVYRTVDAETVVLNLDSGQYHGLNGTAGRMLELLADLESFDATAAAVAAEFGQPVERVTGDLGGLCADLLARGLLEVDPAGPE
jgi:hypothetical protein